MRVHLREAGGDSLCAAIGLFDNKGKAFSAGRQAALFKFVGARSLGIPRFSTLILRAIHVTMVCMQCVDQNVTIKSPEVQMVISKGRHGVDQCMKNYNVMRLLRGRKGDGSVERDFRPYGSIMEGANALHPTIPSTVVASMASIAATLNPVTAAKATTSPMPYRGLMLSASVLEGDKGSEDRSEYMNCKRRRVFAGVSEETIADDVLKINGAVKAV